jgi:hypothetical protein
MLFQLGEQEDSILSQLKGPAPGGNKFRSFKPIFINNISQTGRLRIVVSDGTILYREF